MYFFFPPACLFVFNGQLNLNASLTISVCWLLDYCRRLLLRLRLRLPLSVFRLSLSAYLFFASLSMCMFGRKGSFRKRIGSTLGFSLFLFLFFSLRLFFFRESRPLVFFSLPFFLITILVLMYSMPFFLLSLVALHDAPPCFGLFFFSPFRICCYIVASLALSPLTRVLLYMHLLDWFASYPLFSCFPFFVWPAMATYTYIHMPLLVLP